MDARPPHDMLAAFPSRGTVAVDGAASAADGAAPRATPCLACGTSGAALAGAGAGPAGAGADGAAGAAAAGAGAFDGDGDSDEDYDDDNNDRRWPRKHEQRRRGQ